MSKVLVIGLDGATFDLLLPWIDEGKLPVFSHLMNSGVYGEMMSTVPILTAPAWSSFITGKNPGKHGIVSFLSRGKGGYEMQLINSLHRSEKEIWTILGEKGKKVGVVNVPVTYPPKKVNGFMITGMLTPPKSDKYTYPAPLKEEVEEVIGKNAPGFFFTYLEKEELFISEVFETTEKLAETSFLLFKEHEPDFFMVVFNGTDYVQHKLWKHIDPHHPGHDSAKSKKYSRIVLSYYQRIDEILGMFLKTIDENTTLIVMSDHGAAMLHKYIHVNSWLLQLGLLKLKETWVTKLKRFIFNAGITPERLYNLLFSLRFLNIRLKMRVNKRLRSALTRLFISFSDVDWHKTKAYSTGSGLIFVNLKGREPSGIVDPGDAYTTLVQYIIDKLYDLKDPETGKSVVKKAYRKGEIYNGLYMHQMPDVAFISEAGYMPFEEYEFATKSLITKARAVSATHRLNGILIMKGSMIRKGEHITKTSIMDLAPTILHVMQVPVPADMDGKVLTQAFTPTFLQSNPIKYSTEKVFTYAVYRNHAPVKGEKDYSLEEEEVLKSRLRKLGYFG